MDYMDSMFHMVQNGLMNKKGQMGQTGWKGQMGKKVHNCQDSQMVRSVRVVR